jgi:exopolyphosphatase/guanosine-5'-triphosphate,3'-diphosphate pyrophosphatase
MNTSGFVEASGIPAGLTAIGHLTADPRRKRVAAIDLGTNSLHLLIGDGDGRSRPQVRLSVKDTPRLGEGVVKSGTLSRNAMDRVVSTLRQYAWICRQLSVDRIRAVTTAAVRSARNGRAFVERVRSETGISLVTISGSQEAQIFARGVVSEATFAPGRFMIFNVGGGSTEFAWGDHGQVRGVLSLPLGAVTLTERHLRHDPSRPAQIKALERAIKKELVALPAECLRYRTRLHGTGGAVTSMCGFHEPYQFQLDRPVFRTVPGYRMAKAYQNMQQLDERERRRVLGIKASRAGIIVAGAAIVTGIIEYMGAPELVVSRHGVKHGLLLAEFTPARPGSPD